MAHFTIKILPHEPLRSHQLKSYDTSCVACAVSCCGWSSVGCGCWGSVSCGCWSSSISCGRWSRHHGVGWHHCRGCRKRHHSRHQWLQNWNSSLLWFWCWSWLWGRLFLWLWLRLAEHGENSALEDAKAAKQKQPNPNVHEGSGGARLIPSPAVEGAAVLTHRRGAIVEGI